MPVAPVRAEEWIERAELEPADVQLAGVLARRHEAADIGAPERNAPQRGVTATGTCVFSVSHVV
jgi:hypothetical protein